MNFDKFTGHADKLKAYEGHVISMLKKALQQKRALDAGSRKKTQEEGTEELRLETAKFKLELRENKLSSKEEELEKKRVALQEQEQEQNDERSRFKALRFMLDQKIKRHDEKATTDKQAHETDMMERRAMLDEIMKRELHMNLPRKLPTTGNRSVSELKTRRQWQGTERRIDDFAKHRVNDLQTMPRKSRRELIISWLEGFDHRRASWLHGQFAAFAHGRNRICHDNGVLQVDHNRFLRVCDEKKQVLDQLDEDTRNAHLLL
ncbi:hypothetical protein PR001_g11339 [Phytophthora rubi]|nr:hypothetical protein PR001_g11339 [Phytophthora rubi]